MKIKMIMGKFSRWINLWARKHIIEDILRIIGTVVAGLIIYFRFKDEWDYENKDWFDLSMVSTAAIVILAFVISKGLSNLITSKTEDAAKVQENCEYLRKKYSAMNLIEHNISIIDDKKIKYPVECICKVSPTDKLKFIDSPDKYYELPSRIMESAAEIMKAHNHSKTYNAICIRMDDIIKNEESGDVSVFTSRTHYFDSLVTNRACDYVLTDTRVTVREMMEPGPYMKPLNKSLLSNHLGFHCFVESADGYVPFIHRRKDTSIHKNLWGVGVEASLKSKYAVNKNEGYIIDTESVGNAIINEIRDELKLELFNIVSSMEAIKGICAFYRDLSECGKPQFVCKIKLNSITKDHMLYEFSKKTNKKSNSKNISFDTDGETIQFFTVKELEKAEYADSYIKIKGKEYNMSPSTIASIILFLNNK